MAVSSTSDFSATLNLNFKYHEGDCNSPPSADFSTLLDKKVILVATTHLDQAFDRPQIEFLSRFAREGHCLLVEKLPVHKSARPSELNKFSTLNEAVAIKGFERIRSYQKIPDKAPYIEAINDIHAHQRAYETYREGEKAYFQDLATYLKNLQTEGSLVITGSSLYASPEVVTSINEYLLRPKNTNPQPLFDTARKVTDCTLFNEKNIFGASRHLLDAIKRAAQVHEKVFVLASDVLFIGNTEFYQKLADSSLSYGTLLPIVPEKRTIDLSSRVYGLIEDSAVLGVYQNGALSRFLYIPRMVLHLFTELPEVDTKTTILGKAEFDKAKENGSFKAQPGFQTLIPIDDYRAISEFFRLYPFSDKKEFSQIMYAFFDQLAFSMDVGIREIGIYPPVDQQIVITGNKWHLSFYGQNHIPLQLKLHKGVLWIKPVYLLSEIQKNQMPYKLDAGKELLFTDLSVNENDALQENPANLIHILNSYAPSGTHVVITGTYITTPVFGENYPSLTAISDVSIALGEVHDSRKRFSSSETGHHKKQLTGDIETDLEIVQSDLNKFKINDDED